MKAELTKKLRWYEPETKIVWINVFFFVSMNVGGLYYLFMYPYLEHPFILAWSIFQAQLTMFGVTAGVHRLWSHRSYKANVPLRILLATFYFGAIQHFRIYDWVRNHRQHHKYVDTVADPHNSSRGFWYSHIGWILTKKSELVRQRARGIDMKDIFEDPVVQFFDRNFRTIKVFTLIIIPIVLPVYFFDVSLKWTFVSHYFFRIPLESHCACAINSFAHLYGYRSYNKSIQARENPFVCLAMLGEGFHNYHHTFPWDYKAAEMRNFIFNQTTFWIDMFAKINWAYDLKHPTQEHINSVVKKKGDGSHYSIHTQQ